MTVDTVTLNIIHNALTNIASEMALVMLKTSYSTIFNEGLDFTCALADDKGDMIACAEFCPTMIGGMPLLIKTCAQEIPFNTIAGGHALVAAYGPGAMRVCDHDAPIPTQGILSPCEDRR